MTFTKEFLIINSSNEVIAYFNNEEDAITHIILLKGRIANMGMSYFLYKRIE